MIPRIDIGQLFSGDTVLPGKMGRTPLPGADSEVLACSLRELGGLSRDLLMHPGHGRPTSLGEGLDNACRPKGSEG